MEATETGHRDGDGSVGTEAADMIREEGRRMASMAADRGRHLADAQKDSAAAYLRSIAAAVHRGSRELESRGEAQTAMLAGRAADEVESFANHLLHEDAGHLFHEVEDLARRRPGLVFGGALLVGLGVARFLKAGRPRPDVQRAADAGLGSARPDSGESAHG